MIKLNGNIYLTEGEVERIIDEVSCRFKTSHRAILPKKINYLDVEFVDILKDEAKNLTLSVYYLYGYGEDHASVKKIIKAVTVRMREEDSCTDKLTFMKHGISDEQKRQYRLKYENFLVNVFLEECIVKFKDIS